MEELDVWPNCLPSAYPSGDDLPVSSVGGGVGYKEAERTIATHMKWSYDQIYKHIV